MMIFIILSLCLFGSTMAQFPSFGRCPKVDTTADFDLSQYMGRWYEAQRYFSKFEIAGKCIMADYSLTENNTVNMESSKISIITGELWSVKSTARVPDTTNPSKLKVKLLNDPIGFETDYWVLGTDYKTYAVVYSCYDIQLLKMKYAWILTRERDAPQTVIDMAMAIAEKNGLSRSQFIKTNQSNC
ncbi:apolipoprotein D-like [Venturia canescens]|uniref:apolipoprotein D-like n=1 Tax=Venturia canescens TaxID=32260 RepID=UPI001C9C1A1D|nr:apolipoprotein D-like [Venturia canescens]